MYDLSKTMSKNYDCYQIIAAPKDTFLPAYKEIAHKVVEIPHRKFDFKKLIELRNLVIEKEINIIHSHGRGAGIYSRLLSYMTNAKVVHTFHGIHQVKSFIGLAKDMFDKIFAHRIDHYICVSADEQKKAEEALYLAYDSKSSVVLNGVDTEKFSKVSSPDLSKNEFIIGTLCRFNFQKGIDLAIVCLERNQQFFRENRIKYLLQGDGEGFEEMKKLVEEKGLSDIIQMPGATNNPTEFYEKVNAYVSFSRWEGFPLSVIEAMAAKRPCILSDVPGHQTFIENNLCLSFNIDNFDKFIECLDVLIKNNEQMNGLICSASKYISGNLTLERMTASTQKIYNDLIFC